MEYHHLDQDRHNLFLEDLKDPNDQSCNSNNQMFLPILQIKS